MRTAISTLFFAIQPEANGNGAQAIGAFSLTAGVIGMALLLVGLDTPPAAHPRGCACRAGGVTITGLRASACRCMK